MGSAHRITHVMLALILMALLTLIAMVASDVRGGPLDPADSPSSTMKSLDDIPGSWSRTLPADDGLPGPDPPQGCDSSRFECLEEFFNSAVLDRETGLVWDITADAVPSTWASAHHLCYNKPSGTVNGERRGWRLPTYEELQSLVQVAAGAGNTYLPFGHPFDVPITDKYWTATSVTATSAREWSFASPPTGSVNGEDKTQENYFWCVRGGKTHDGQ